MTDKIRSRYAGHSLLGPLVETYVQELPGVIAELAAAMQAEARPEVLRLSHRLAGDAATYGFDEIAQAAKQLEQACGIIAPGAMSPTAAAPWPTVEASFALLPALLARVEP